MPHPARCPGLCRCFSCQRLAEWPPVLVLRDHPLARVVEFQPPQLSALPQPRPAIQHAILKVDAVDSRVPTLSAQDCHNLTTDLGCHCQGKAVKLLVVHVRCCLLCLGRAGVHRLEECCGLRNWRLLHCKLQKLGLLRCALPVRRLHRRGLRYSGLPNVLQSWPPRLRIYRMKYRSLRLRAHCCTGTGSCNSADWLCINTC
mmetsp:Transcript_111016/g.358375  ORF Transcript_111016/g.358375 Transcript_111016/m.358375 type:complete len:201 (+) Transcript_111016:996-1598(+)